MRVRAERVFGQVDPLVEIDRLDEGGAVDEEGLLVGVLRPAVAGVFEHVGNLIGGDLLGQSDVRVVRIRLLESQRAGVERGVELFQLLEAFSQFQVDHGRDGEDVNVIQPDMYGGEAAEDLFDEARRFFGGSAERTRRQQGDVRAQAAARDKFLAEAVDETPQWLGEVGDQRKEIDPGFRRIARVLLVLVHD